MRSFRSIAISIGVAVLKQPRLICLPFFTLVIAATWSVRNNFFFWDTMQLASQHAHFFYENNNFSTFLLPDEMDSGHPPTFGFYLALVWKLFGKTLIISHLAMLPFLIGIIWQAWQLAEKVVGEGWALLFLSLLTVCPVVAGQAVLVSPDVVLLFFFLMALNSIFRCANFLEVVKSPHAHIQLSVAILGLSAISMRGMMLIGGLFIFYFLIKIDYFRTLIINRSFNFKSLANNVKTIRNDSKLNDLTINKAELNTIKSSEFNSKFLILASKTPLSIKGILSIISPFLLGISFAFSFLIYHFMYKGWIGFHTNSPWQTAFETVNTIDFIKNVIVLIWRLIDFGHLFLWLIIIYSLMKINKLFLTTRLLMALLITLLVVLTPTLLIYKGLLAHRYLMPIYVVLILLATKIISDLRHYKQQLIMVFIAFMSLASGNLWVYPQPISTGWDATLAHLPFYALRREMLQFIDSQQISYKDIGSSFPNQRDFETTDLKNTPPSVQNHFSTYNFEKNRFIFYSNIMNDFTDTDLKTLKMNWHSIKSLKKGQVTLILFEKNN